MVNGSPKIKSNQSVSELFVNLQENSMKEAGIDVGRINVRDSITLGKTQEDYLEMSQADAIIFTFPLYIFCLPGILMRFLQDYQQFLMKQNLTIEKEQKIFAVVNCGFPEPDINEEAVRVIKSFSRQIGALFGFGVMIGGGGMFLGTIDAPFMKKTKAELYNAFDQMSEMIIKMELSPMENRFIKPNFPRKLYLFAADREWISAAKKNGLKKRDLYRRPYLK
nr:flavodoxin [Mobilitalea sibirica]